MRIYKALDPKLSWKYQFKFMRYFIFYNCFILIRGHFCHYFLVREEEREKGREGGRERKKEGKGEREICREKH